MLELYLNGERVYPDSQLKIKLTKENPYFSQSDTYTFDVSLPTDILPNRKVMLNIQRMDRSKRIEKMAARLLVDNKVLLDGSAIVTQVNENAVKVQLIQGYPSLKLLMKDNDDFIDQIEMGSGIDPNANRHISLSATFKAQGVKGQHVYLPIYNETTEKIMNKYHFDQDTNDVVYSNMVGQDLAAVQPNLFYILKMVFAHFGFTLDLGSYNQEPWNSIYIANCKATRKLSKALPHWRASDFFTEVSNLLCAKYVVSEAEKKVTLTPLKGYVAGNSIPINPISEYETEIEEESESTDILSSNIKYSVSSSIFHEWDIVSQEVVRACQPISYSDFTELSVEESLKSHKNNILVCPTGYYAYWERKNEMTTPACRRNKGAKLMNINQFGDLTRNEDSESIELKICPVAMTDRQHLNDKNTSYYIYTHMPSMSEYEYEATSVDDMTAQERIESAYSIDTQKEESSSDLMEIFFFDNTFMLTEYHNTGISHEFELRLPMAFTDADMLLPTSVSGKHKKWSMALGHCSQTYYIGQLHQVSSLFDTKAKYAFKFLSDNMPDPTMTYIIKGKLYGCEKIEANINADGFDRLMTGYFYEMLS